MSDLRKDLEAIYSRAISSVSPVSAVRNYLRLENGRLLAGNSIDSAKEFDLIKYNKIIVVGAGKATAGMAKAVEEILGPWISEGLIIVKYGYTEELDFIKTLEASHPVPDENGIEGARKIRELLLSADENDLVISLISGGGSSLMPLPPENIPLEDKKKATDLLLKCGAGIHEINAVRKHISLVKGGNLARAAYPATVINLMISDVVGDNMDVIASGPFVPDNSTFEDAGKIIAKYKLQNSIPSGISDYINLGAGEKIDDNPKHGDVIFGRVVNYIIASNMIALSSAKEEGENSGYNTIILSSLFQGETENLARMHSEIAKEAVLSSNPASAPLCLLSGGETTVRVRGNGMGGRNMEFTMHAALHINGYKNILIASVGTDGTDGPTDAAGAFADGTTVLRAEKKGISITDYIENNDSYNFFKQLGDLIITGPTNTNVMDIRIILIK
ncbi:MAG: glycerate kinase [Spirochaetes bacterium]|nr:glycerate kinase [Spirochaetota bacterium]